MLGDRIVAPIAILMWIFSATTLPALAPGDDDGTVSSTSGGKANTVGFVVTRTHSNPGGDNNNESEGSNGTHPSTPDPCWYTPVAASPGDPRLGGKNLKNGNLYAVSCPDAINLDTGNLVYGDSGYVWVEKGDPFVPPPPNPKDIAESAAALLTAPDPDIRIGPDPAKIAVKVPLWLSVSVPTSPTFTIGVRGLSVTVTARMLSTSWSMGEPIDPANPAVRVASFTCVGNGTPAPPHVAATVRPPCGYTYHWRSLPSRTRKTGTWTITATTEWVVAWTASTGESGTLNRRLTPSSTRDITVGEWRSNFVADPGG